MVKSSNTQRYTITASVSLMSRDDNDDNDDISPRENVEGDNFDIKLVTLDLANQKMPTPTSQAAKLLAQDFSSRFRFRRPYFVRRWRGGGNESTRLKTDTMYRVPTEN